MILLLFFSISSSSKNKPFSGIERAERVFNEVIDSIYLSIYLSIYFFLCNFYLFNYSIDDDEISAESYRTLRKIIKNEFSGALSRRDLSLTKDILEEIKQLLIEMNKHSLTQEVEKITRKLASKKLKLNEEEEKKASSDEDSASDSDQEQGRRGRGEKEKTPSTSGAASLCLSSPKKRKSCGSGTVDSPSKGLMLPSKIRRRAETTHDGEMVSADKIGLVAFPGPYEGCHLVIGFKPECTAKQSSKAPKAMEARGYSKGIYNPDKEDNKAYK